MALLNAKNSELSQNGVGDSFTFLAYGLETKVSLVPAHPVHSNYPKRT